MQKNNSKIESRLKTLPKSPGVYIMKDEQGEPIYVGKALDLSKRVRSYFYREQTDIKTIRLVEKIDDIQWLVTDTELEALMLETTLIKKYRPKYNILMKDDKNYIYIKITNDYFPRVITVRRVQKDGASYFGPYTNGLKVNKILRSINRIFPFFTYQNSSGVSPMDSVAGKELFQKRSQTAWGDLSVRGVYVEMISDLKKFLRGNAHHVIDIFKNAMKEAANEKNYEQAAILRDRIRDINQIVEGQKVVSPKKIDVDVVGYYGQKNKWVVTLLVVRDGKIVDIRNMQAVSYRGEDLPEMFARFVVDYYARTQDYPKYVYLPLELTEQKILCEYMEVEYQKKIKFEFPKIGEKKQMIELANKNAKMEYLRQQSVIKFARNEGLGIVDLINKLHDLNWDSYKFRKIKDVFRIEGYDISSLGDSGVVGAMVVWELKSSNKFQVSSIKGKNKHKKIKREKKEKMFEQMKKWKGGFNKSYYKRFEIKSFQGQDDFGAMKEVFRRRFAKVKRENKKWIYPDLILVDGGKGQLGVVLRVLDELAVDVPVISLAKREEEVWAGRDEVSSFKYQVSSEENQETRTKKQEKSDKENHEKERLFGSAVFEYKKLDIEKGELAGLLLQSIRNEVHRFAVSYQRIIRKKEVRKSVLDRIEGLGPITKKKLLKEFGSIKGIIDAGEEKVAKVVGEKMVRRIFEVL